MSAASHSLERERGSLPWKTNRWKVETEMGRRRTNKSGKNWGAVYRVRGVEIRRWARIFLLGRLFFFFTKLTHTRPLSLSAGSVWVTRWEEERSSRATGPCVAALESRSPARLIALATITSCRLSLVLLRRLLDRAEEPVTAAQVTGRPSPEKIALDPKRLSQREREKV